MHLGLKLGLRTVPVRIHPVADRVGESAPHVLIAAVARQLDGAPQRSDRRQRGLRTHRREPLGHLPHQRRRVGDERCEVGGEFAA